MIYGIYYLLSIFFLLASSLYRVLNKPFEIIFLLLIIILSGFRYYVGTDYKTYDQLADMIANGQSTYMELGFETIITLIQNAGFLNQGVFLVSTLITIVFFWIYFRNNSSNVLYSLILFFLLPAFYFASFNGVRQFIAISIFLYATKSILTKDFAKYCFLIVLASFFHKTVLLLLPCYFFLAKEPSLFRLLITAAIYFVVINVLGQIGPTLGGPEKYFSDVFDYDFNLKSLVPVIIFISLFCLNKKYRDVNTDYVISFNLLFVASLFTLTPLFSELPSGLVLRMSSYFTPAILIVLVNFSQLFQQKIMKIFYNTFLFILASLYFSITLISNGEKYALMPYSFNLTLF